MQTSYGSVSVTNGTNLVTGDSNCDWQEVLDSFNAGIPAFFSVVGQIEVPYQISSITAPAPNWTLTLAANYAGQTNSSADYVIQKDYTTNLQLPLFAANDRQTAQLLSRAFMTLDSIANQISLGLYRVKADLNLTTTFQELFDLRGVFDTSKFYQLRYGILFKTANVASVPNVKHVFPATPGYYGGYGRVITGAAGTAASYDGVIIPAPGGSSVFAPATAPAINVWYLMELVFSYGLGGVAQLHAMANNATGVVTIGAGSYLIATQLAT